MTKFSFEVPIKHLQDFEPYQDYHFALSFLFAKYPEYRSYIKRVTEAGSQLIIDNSFNELKRPEELTDLVNLYFHYGAEAIVCPDSDAWSFEEQCNMYNEATISLGSSAVWPVVRWTREIDYCSGTNFPIIAIPYEYRLFLPLRNVRKRMHFLGFNNPSEVINFRPVSVDTSMPVKLVLAGLTVYDWVMQGCKHFHTHEMPDFFDLELTKDQLHQSIANIHILKKICNEQDFRYLYGERRADESAYRVHEEG